MTDGELLRGYQRARCRAEFMVRAAEGKREKLEEIAGRLKRLGRMPDRTLYRAFGTTKAELIPEPVIRAYARKHGIQIREQTAGVVSEYCRGCTYLSKAWGHMSCGYLSATGERRGCPAGDGCIRHTRREHK